MDVFSLSPKQKKKFSLLKPNFGTLPFGKKKVIIAGPCAVESREQMMTIAESVIKSGADVFRAGAFKPRTSPDDFQGLGEKGIELLLEVKKKFHIPVVSEIVREEDMNFFKDVDVLQIGARNMQNFSLLSAVGRSGKPVLLKRGFSNTLYELLMSAMYIINEGNSNVILCERGIRTFETSSRFTLDISAVPILKSVASLPVIVDPSHALGNAEFVPSMSLASIAAGADGIMTEVHSCPSKALCDGSGSLDLPSFAALAAKIRSFCEATAIPSGVFGIKQAE